MSGDSSADLVHRQLLVITLALAAGVVTFALVVVGMGLAGLAGAGSVEGPVRLGAALLGVALLVVAPILSGTLTRAPREADRAEVAQRLQSGFIIGQALREAVGLIGVVAGYLTGDVVLMAALVTASVATMLVALPGRDALRRRLDRR